MSRYLFSRPSIFILLFLVVMIQGCSGGSSGGGGFNPVEQLDAVQCAAGTSTGPVNNLDCSSGSGNVWISGQITFDRVHHVVGGSALDYYNITRDPVRGATVDAVYAGGIQSVATDATGHYSVCVPANTNMTIRAKAQMYRTGAPAWNFKVVDNTSNQALYALGSSTFNSNNTTTLNLHADSGWDTTTDTGYINQRAAAPFAILDSVYEAYNKILPECSGIQFPELKLNWSVNNVPVEGDPAIGQITTSAFDGSQIYILGKEDNDTDEYDGHVIIHEFGHYFEHYFSRADSVGGPHSGGNILDARVAFSEGFGNAFSAIVTDDADYNDANGTNQSSGFELDIDNNNCTNSGWYSECSVQSILYDLYDVANDSADNINLNFTPLFDVLIDEQRNTDAVTSLFSFIHELKLNNPGSITSINSLVSAQNVDVITDIYGDSELTNNPGSVDKLPLHETISPGETVNVCSTSEHQEYNGLGVYRFLRFTASANQTYRITATRTSGSNPSDPDIQLHYKGQTAFAESVVTNSETMNIKLTQSGTYIIDVYDYNNFFLDMRTACFDVQLLAI
ncbi:MAG TPA: pre-peptidase C-terminal domain-containing protein [Gammaproteobacteria bacterium]